MKRYLVTGGAGFIGGNFVKYILNKTDDVELIILDKLTYAGNLDTIDDELKDKRVTFIKGDIVNSELVDYIFSKYDIDYVINFAAESHVDRSIEEPKVFLNTNIIGTQTLMEIAKKYWSIGKDNDGYPLYKKNKKFIQISTDEVYGTLDIEYPEGIELKLNEDVKSIAKDRKDLIKYGEDMFREDRRLDPRSPYSVSKASADMLVIGYGETYKFPYNITRCSNNYGGYQYPEKLIPLMIKNILEGRKLPVYGRGENVRDWLYVEDHCKGIEKVVREGKIGEIYNIGGFNEKRNIDIVKIIIGKMSEIMRKEERYRELLRIEIEDIDEGLIEYVQDRLGHDKRYAIDPEKIVKELGWYPETPFEIGIEKTIYWYLDNQSWIEKKSF